MAIITTPGAANANSYVTLAEVDSYFNTAFAHGTTFWNSSEAAILHAARLIDRLSSFFGTKADQAQAMAWPRFGVYNEDGWLIDEATIPQRVKDAQCELAGFLAREDRTEGMTAQGLDELKIGPLDLKFSNGGEPELVPDVVWEMLAPYLLSASGGGMGSSPVVRA